ncbi:MAG: class I fructose-bisphosphate aldolase, partial [Acidimicrobiales bacterium]
MTAGAAMGAPGTARREAERTSRKAAGLHATARALVSEGKGILAADESIPTISKRLYAFGIEPSEEIRREYRELLFGAPGIEEHVSGAILHDETLSQRSADGLSFPQLLQQRGILPGIKVDTGVRPLAGTQGEVATEGLDGLAERLAGYRDQGACFAKWRAVLDISGSRPSSSCIVSNAHALAMYAAACQAAGVVPIVEPEVLTAGSHDLARCGAATRQVLSEVFSQLQAVGVDLRGVVLKASMVLPGTSSGSPVHAHEVAAATVACLRDTVPSSVPGVAFLSGGQAACRAVAHLDAISRLGPHPWD